MRDATKIVRAGTPAPAQGTPFMPGPVFAAPYHAAGDVATASYTYGRFHNPTWSAFEQALGELEGGQALVFASGMAAIAAVFGVLLRPGDVVVVSADSYATTRALIDGYFVQMGVQVRQVPTAAITRAEMLQGAKLVWAESPSNPTLDVCDIAALSAAAHTVGALVAVDNTTPTVRGQRPLALGADLSVASDTKALTGHSDVILGHVATNDAALLDKLRMWRTQMGSIAGPMEVWLAHRSLATLDVRLERQCRSALAVALFLAKHPQVVFVRYPGLPADPSHAVAARQMQLFGPVVSFALADKAAAEHFLGACALVAEATSFGGVHTTAERRARWGGDAIDEGFIRMSIGCEDVQDILDDLEHALATLPTRTTTTD